MIPLRYVKTYYLQRMLLYGYYGSYWHNCYYRYYLLLIIKDEAHTRNQSEQNEPAQRTPQIEEIQQNPQHLRCPKVRFSLPRFSKARLAGEIEMV